jgi:hypothetical protein
MLGQKKNSNGIYPKSAHGLGIWILAKNIRWGPGRSKTAQFPRSLRVIGVHNYRKE